MSKAIYKTGLVIGGCKDGEFLSGDIATKLRVHEPQPVPATWNNAGRYPDNEPEDVAIATYRFEPGLHTESVSVDFWLLDTLTLEDALQMLCARYSERSKQ